MTTTDARPLVVGIDESPQSQLALRWAVDEARNRGYHVRLVSVYELTARPFDYEPATIGAHTPMRDRFDEAIAYAFDRLGTERVSHAYVAGNPAQVLLTEAESAAMVVVGSATATRTAAVLMGSVSSAVAAHARCPVVVVRTEQDPAPTGPVVVGVDGSPQSGEAARVAFEQAHDRGLDLQIVHCWRPVLGPIDPVRWESSLLADEVDERETWVDERVAAVAKEYPDVRATTELVEARAAEELTARSKHATMIVVGSRGHGGVSGLLLGSVSQALLHHADCTVIVTKAAAGRGARQT